MEKKKLKTTPKKTIRNGKYCRQKGHSYELKIAKELREIGYKGIVTSRSESKRMDDNKIDLVDIENKLECYIQLKNTVSTPQYFTIESGCSLKDKPFVLIWNKQVKGNTNFKSEGELVIMPKDYFYKLIKK